MEQKFHGNKCGYSIYDLLPLVSYHKVMIKTRKLVTIQVLNSYENCNSFAIDIG